MLKVRLIMDEKKVSRAALSDASGIAQERIDLLVMGIDKPTSDEAKKIADALAYERDADELFVHTWELYDN